MTYLITLTEGFVMAGQLLLGLSILVILHEFGHYITAKWFGCRVEKFYLFFDPWFSVVKKKVGETEYGIGWLPLGGYVKIAGMIDESMDKEALAQPAQPWEFRSKPAWQRLIIMLGGVIMNVLVAFIIYAFTLFTWGETNVPNNSLKYGIAVHHEELNKAGFKGGDKVISVDGKTIENLEDVPKKILFGTEDRKVVVERDGKNVEIIVSKALLNNVITNKKEALRGFILPRVPSVIFPGDSLDNNLSYRSGMRNNDKVISIDSTSIEFFDQIQSALRSKVDKQVAVKILRGVDTVKLMVQVDCNGKIGVGYLSGDTLEKLGILKAEKKTFSLAEAFPAGIKKTFTTLGDYVDQFKMILTPSTGAYKGMGGFKGMAKIYGSYWDWERFWGMTAMISIILAFMNLLPIPALDGGHVVFTLYEMLFKRKPNDKFLEYAQMAGMVFLLGLMLFANGNDWFGWGKDNNTECKKEYKVSNGIWSVLDKK